MWYCVCAWCLTVAVVVVCADAWYGVDVGDGMWMRLMHAQYVSTACVAAWRCDGCVWYCGDDYVPSKCNLYGSNCIGLEFFGKNI